MLAAMDRALVSVGVPVADHLWQSTWFGLLVGLLVLLLGSYAARYRFSLWLIASCKFLVPFALLVRAGRWLGPPHSIALPGAFSSSVEIVSRPFGVAASRAVLHATWFASLETLMPLVLAGVWVAGFVGVSLLWSGRWRQVARIRRGAETMRHGSELEILRGLTCSAGLPALPVLLCKDRMEPGIFGVWQPVLLWPQGLSAQLQPAQLRAVLAHEVWHVRRRDNLAAALQMFIEACFWFHPLVWWLGARQITERERACNEGVLESGEVAATYAEAILSACKYCVGSPLACVAGVNGSNLTKRMVRIMNYQSTDRLSSTRKLALAALAVTVVGSPVILGATSASTASAQDAPSTSTASPVRVTELKRSASKDAFTRLQRTPGNGTSITGVSVKALIEIAYSLKPYQLSGGPSWIDQDKYDIALSSGPSTGPVQGFLSGEESQALQALLAQRFHLVLQQETKPGPVWALVVGQAGAKLVTATPRNAPGTNEPIISVRVKLLNGSGEVEITGGLGALVDALADPLGRPVIDKTGLTGLYAIDFHWVAGSDAAQAIAEDLKDQLGLELVSEQGLVQSSVIGSVVPAASL